MPAAAAAPLPFLFCLLPLLFLQHATAQTTHDVGDSTGWTVPPSGAAFYSDWAAKNTFSVGDSLRFAFTTGSHSVLKVSSKESFDGCKFENGNGDIMTTGPATVPLNSTGMHYFVCTIGPHCSLGQKVAINVGSTAAGGPMSPPLPAAQSPPPSPSSANALAATLYLTFSAVLMALF
ncbi:cucumber peeling cupredoxin-like [Cucurbita maxima]|uniref:Cucumber peeling cupredoxin-like n=1 Tax=Cucurbita maxima TaxID=3661 RepID=A0A6J1JSI5_CUCMA|nr:cucumber peeling cupredoxin-like [Cucurbita maxima]XP_022991285.1 cucumber peeling cupredoxin-like [Cucurbita maxima]